MIRIDYFVKNALMKLMIRRIYSRVWTKVNRSLLTRFETRSLIAMINYSSWITIKILIRLCFKTPFFEKSVLTLRSLSLSRSLISSLYFFRVIELLIHDSRSLLMLLLCSAIIYRRSLIWVSYLERSSLYFEIRSLCKIVTILRSSIVYFRIFEAIIISLMKLLRAFAMIFVKYF